MQSEQSTHRRMLNRFHGIDLDQNVDIHSIGFKIDQLIRSNIMNWERKEVFFSNKTPIEEANRRMIELFQANKARNKIITEINIMLHGGPKFHFRNYHNY